MVSLPLRSVTKDDLRDPTLEELYTGPVRALPDEIQQLPEEDTACTFCGVSYFVFAEVQTLQTAVKQYKKSFRDVVQFLEHERSDANNLRQQVTDLKSDFAELVVACSTNIKHLLEQSEKHCTAKQDQVLRLQNELFAVKNNCQELQTLCRHNEEDQRANARIEHELRNENLHLLLQAESCKSQCKSQQVAFEVEHDQAQQRIRDLELTLVEWTETRRQKDTECDDLKQKLQALNEHIEQKSSSVVQLEKELGALREECDRVVAVNDTERQSYLSEILQLKDQLQSLKTMHSQLVSEKERYKDENCKLEDRIATLRLAAEHLQGQLNASAKLIEKVKNDNTRNLDKVQEDCEEELHRLQQDHARAIKEMKTSHDEHMEYVQQETAKLESRNEKTSREALAAIRDRLQDAERRANKWKDRALQNASECEERKRSFETINQALQNQLATSDRDKQKVIEDANKQRTELEQRLKCYEHQARQERNALHQEAINRQQILQVENTALQEQLAILRPRLERLESQSTIDTKPKVAWQSNQTGTRKTSCHDTSDQDCHDSEEIVNQLRGKLKQKDREIALLQQTVHRECMERTSLLERIRGGNVKVLPETGIALSTSSDSVVQSNFDYTDGSNECLDQSAKQPKASFYEKLRRAGSRKAKAKNDKCNT